MSKESPVPKPRHEPVGQRVRRLRLARGLSQDRVSLGANVDQSGYSKFERGVRSLGENGLRRIANVLGMGFEDLVKDTDYGDP